MDAALALLWEQSYGAVTIDDICQRADVKKGSFYYFFSSKSDLAVQALERHWQQMKRDLDETFSPATPPLDRIRQKCARTYQSQVEMKRLTGQVLGCRLCSLGSEICTLDHAIRDKVCAIKARQQCYWETAIRDAQAAGVLGPGDVAAKARCAIAFFEGMVAQARLNNDPQILRDLPQLMVDHLRSAVGGAVAAR